MNVTGLYAGFEVYGIRCRSRVWGVCGLDHVGVQVLASKLFPKALRTHILRLLGLKTTVP